MLLWGGEECGDEKDADDVGFRVLPTIYLTAADFP
jgi:hypothetical protein